MTDDIQHKPLSLDDIAPDLGERSFLMNHDLLLLNDVSSEDLLTSPVQLGFLLIGICRSGRIDLMVNGRLVSVRAGDLIISLGGQILHEEYRSDDFHASVVLMSRSFAQDCVVGLNYMWPYLLYVLKNPVIALGEEERLWILECYNLLRRRMHKATGRYKRDTIVALTRAFYFEICDLLDTHVQPNRTASHNRSYAIFDTFIRLVSQHFKEQRGVEWYSREMCLTPKHLSEVVKSVSGRTAGQWITTMVIIEIKTLLQNSSLSIKEIAIEMNFPNQSFLGKYFKNVEGISPTDFRRQLG